MLPAVEDVLEGGFLLDGWLLGLRDVHNGVVPEKSILMDMPLSQKKRTQLLQEIWAIPHNRARVTLLKGLEQVKTKADLSSFMETLHLLRSPANAERLFEAMDEANQVPDL